jgi:hypothetical protein
LESIKAVFIANKHNNGAGIKKQHKDKNDDVIDRKCDKKININK